MIYKFMTLDDATKIVHSEMRPDGTAKVYMERPDVKAVISRTTAGRISQAFLMMRSNAFRR